MPKKTIGIGLLVGIIAVGAWFLFFRGDPKVGVEFMPTMEAASDDLDDFWNDFLRRNNYRGYYESPDNITYYDPEVPQETPCGETVPNNAFYCILDNSIYFDEVFLENMFNEGAYGPVYIAAHEWAHLVQRHLGILVGPSFTIQTELQADCLAGQYTRDVDDRDFITNENLLEAVRTLIMVGDPLLYPWWAPGAHGDAQDRVNAFTLGYNEGWGACIAEPLFIPPRVEESR